jgi:trigger factor
MNISLESIDKVFALLTVKIEKLDYQEQVDTSLKTLRRKVQIPGFRKGMVPMGLVQKMYRKSVILEEIDKLLSNKVNAYFKENNINLFGYPQPNKEKQPEIDFDTMADLEFVYDIAIIPEIKPEVSENDEVNYYTVEVTKEMLDEQIKSYTQHNGKYEKVDSYRENDFLKGLITELDENGNTKEGGIQVENAVIMPAYMKDDAQKAIFNDAKVDDVLVFNPNKAYDGHNAEIASLLSVDKSIVEKLTSDFSFRVNEITRFVEGELNQELFDTVLGEGAVKNEEEFRAKVKESFCARITTYSDHKLIADIRELLTKKVELASPETSLKRFLTQTDNKDDGSVDEYFEEILKNLKWQLIKENLVKEYNIEVDQDDITNTAIDVTRIHFVEYGLVTMSDEFLKKYTEELLKKEDAVTRFTNRAIELKLANKLKEKIKLVTKTMPYDEFTKLLN